MTAYSFLAVSAVWCAHLAAAAPVQCTSALDRPQWPTFHFFNKVTVPAGGGGPVMEPLNDANAIFQHRGVFHVMMQAGGGNWTHGVAAAAGDAAFRWRALPDVLQRAPLRQVSVAVRRIGDGQSALSALSDAESSSGSISNIHS